MGNVTHVNDIVLPSHGLADYQRAWEHAAEHLRDLIDMAPQKRANTFHDLAQHIYDQDFYLDEPYGDMLAAVSLSVALLAGPKLARPPKAIIPDDIVDYAGLILYETEVSILNSDLLGLDADLEAGTTWLQLFSYELSLAASGILHQAYTFASRG